MNRTVRRISAGFGVGALALILGLAQNAKATMPADEVPAVDDIMKKVCSKKGAAGKCTTAIAAEKWEDAKKQAKIMADLGSKLGKNDPPAGDKADWDKLTKKFAKDAKAVADATEKKDKEAATTAIKAFTNKKNCSNCHSKHKG
ncbi:MAG TPA: hypothetical protein VGJ05_13985 [Fimbriiglobus sp.]|jgi:hypothetical protein